MKYKDCLNPKYFISWGKGLQSTALAVMSCLEKIRKVDAIITAETGWEHPHTYKIEKFYTDWFIEHGIPVYKVQDGDIHNDTNLKYNSLPLWTSETGAPLRRQCTGNYKINPIRRKMRELCGLRMDNRGRTSPKTAILFLGISMDEAERMSMSTRAWIYNEYPLVDLKLNRTDCKTYLQDLGLPIPLKSSCVICPYKGASSWEFTKRNYPEEFSKAIEFDKKIRNDGRLVKSKPRLQYFLYKNLKPLEEENFELVVEKNNLMDICDSGYCFV